jgi:phage terminase small subunit
MSYRAWHASCTGSLLCLCKDRARAQKTGPGAGVGGETLDRCEIRGLEGTRGGFWRPSATFGDCKISQSEYLTTGTTFANQSSMIETRRFLPPPEGEMGPKMSALTTKQQAFIVAIMELGTRDFTRAAAAAGYSEGGSHGALKVTAFRLAHDPRIQEAMFEFSQRRMNSGGPIAVDVVFEIMTDPTHKDRLKAAQIFLDRTGLHAKSEHKVTVEDVSKTDEAMVARFLHLAKQNKMPIEQIRATLEGTGVVIDADFTVVEPKIKEEWEE